MTEVKPLAVCALFKNEAPFLLEWIAYHRVVGFDHFFLYDNESTDGGAALIRASALAACATVVQWPQRPGQLAAYRHFIDTFAAGFEWVAFIDLDEFLLPLHGIGICELLRSSNDFSAVLVNWRVFGPSGWEQPPDGLVIENYRLRAADTMPVNRHVKSIVKCADLLDVTQNPHEFRVRGPVCNTLGHVVDNVAIQPAACHEALVVNHYITRSRHDWMAKIQRGSAMFDEPALAYDAVMFEHFAEICRTRDDTIATFAAKVRALLATGTPMARGHDDDGARTATPVRPAPGGETPATALMVSSQLIPLGPGSFSLALLPLSGDAEADLPAARVCLPPRPAGRPAVSISMSRDDGWLSGADASATIHAGADGGEVLVTTYWPSALGAAATPRLRLRRLDARESIAAGSANARHAETKAPDRHGGGIIAHIQGSGDIIGNIGDWIGVRGSRWIEGIGITPGHGILPEDLAYRAVLGRDWLSPWLAGGTFCGSRGLALPLRGVCLRLHGAARANHEVACSATFVDGSEIGLASAERVCAATLAPLEALRIVLRPRRP